MSALEELRTAAWYGDRTLDLSFPPEWNVSTLNPETPPPLSDSQIVRALARPVGQPPLRILAAEKVRPLIIVDDLTRPTPCARVMPFLLEEFLQAGIGASDVTVLMATGTHGAPRADAMAKKIGPEAAAQCRLIVHDDTRDAVRVGRTSFGTAVYVNREVPASDLIVGIGGIYPQHSTGFGGGSKLALGVLGRRSITRLHFGHSSSKGSYDVDNDFRRELDEIARIIGLRSLVSLHVDAGRRPVRIASGDWERYYRGEVAFAKQAYRAPLPDGADVVISNAYPIDVSLTFMRSKGVIPLVHAPPHASKILISACSEGVGHHGLFPFISTSKFDRPRRLARYALARPRRIPQMVAGRLKRKLVSYSGKGTQPAGQAATFHEQRKSSSPIWLYLPEQVSLPERIPGMQQVHSWRGILDRVGEQHAGRGTLEVVVYPCSPLQVLDTHTMENASLSSPELQGAD
ncbi:MAG: DUF2088 domain-containing protein [Actinobacteria bacterium]|nr:DUF2088 domain-containing protein [Actinomycetota bacterium]